MRPPLLWAHARFRMGILFVRRMEHEKKQRQFCVSTCLCQLYKCLDLHVPSFRGERGWPMLLIIPSCPVLHHRLKTHDFTTELRELKSVASSFVSAGSHIYVQLYNSSIVLAPRGACRRVTSCAALPFACDCLAPLPCCLVLQRIFVGFDLNS